MALSRRVIFHNLIIVDQAASAKEIQKERPPFSLKSNILNY